MEKISNKVYVNNIHPRENSAKQTSNSVKSEIPMYNAEKFKKLETLGLTLDEYNEIIAENPDFDTLNIEEQLSYVESYKKVKQAQVQEESEAQHSENISSQKSDKFNKEEYNNKTVAEKFEILKYEIAKNIYINGAPGLKKSDGSPIEAHGQEAWDRLTDEEKSQVVNDVLTYVRNHDDLNELLTKIETGIQSNDGGVSDMTEMTLDYLMNVLQTANIAGESKTGMSVTEFLKKSDAERANAVNEYLQLSVRNKNDEHFLNNQKLVVEYIKDLINSDRPADKNVDIDLPEAYEYMKYNYNMTQEEVLYQAYKKIPENERTPKQQDFLNRYSDFLESENGKVITKAEKIAKFNELELEYETIKNKPQKTSEDNRKLRMLEQYFASKDADTIKEYKNDIPKPTNDFERIVQNDGEELKEKLLSSEYSGSKFEALEVMNFVKDKIKDKSDDEKKEYIKAFIRLNPSSAASELYTYYSKQFPELLEDKSLLMYAGSHVDSMSADQMQKFTDNLAETSKGSKFEKEVVAINTQKTAAKILKSERCADEKFDAHKASYTDMAANKFDYLNEEDAIDSLNEAFDVNTTIKNEDVQKNSVYNIIDSRNMNDKTAIHILDNGFYLHKNNQAGIVNDLTDKYGVAAKHVALSEDLISKYDKIAQTDIFKGTHEALNKWFDDEELVNYSKSLSNQIAKCDKNNQLDMHKEIMTSKSSEVIEHAASNIKNYDATVQLGAIDTVFESGNKKAIETVINDIKYIGSPEVKQLAENRALFYSLVNDSNLTEKDLKERFLSGELTYLEIRNLSSGEKKHYMERYFNKLTSEQKIKLISKIKNNSQLKIIYTMLARVNSPLLNDLLDDPRRADKAMELNLPDFVRNKVVMFIRQKAQTSEDFRKLALKHKIKSDFNADNKSVKSLLNNLGLNSI